jgi:hypothetical protein
VVVLAVEQPESISPGWMIASPGLPASLRAKTWEALRTYWLPPRDTSAPKVPLQQVDELPELPLSFTFPPETPREIGAFCAP